MIGYILWWFVVGLIVGAIARLLVRGHFRLGLIGTAGLGIAGSFVGGFLGYMLFGHDAGQGAFQPSGLIGSVIGAVLLLWIWRRSSEGHARRRRRL